MSRQPWVFIPWMPGTNCHLEMAEAFKLAGARPEIVPLNRLDRPKLYEADLIGFAGGFCWGDHFGTARVAAIDFIHGMRDELSESLARKIPMLGVCNGFQILTATGLLPMRTMGQPTAALDMNLSGRFEHWNSRRLVLHERAGVDCVWTRQLDGLAVGWPTAHAEGRLVLSPGQPALHVVATYGTYEGTAEYPISPNGSAVAGICDASGLIAGFMPHPERRIDYLLGGGDGLSIFVNGVVAVR